MVPEAPCGSTSLPLVKAYTGRPDLALPSVSTTLTTTTLLEEVEDAGGVDVEETVGCVVVVTGVGVVDTADVTVGVGVRVSGVRTW